MSSVTAVIASDFHIRTKNRFWRHKDKPCGDIVFGLENLVKTCEKYNPELLILCGDLFDSTKITPDCIATFKKLEAKTLSHIKKVYVQGQHDLFDPPIISVLSDDFIHLNRKKYKSDSGLTFYGLDYHTEEPLPVCPSDIFITHQVWKEILGFHGKSLSALKDFDIVISGDYHHYVKKQLSSFTFYSPGTLVPNNIAETESNILILYGDKRIERIQLPKRGFYNFTILNHENLDEILNKYPEEKIIDDSLPEDLRFPIIEVIAVRELFHEISDKYKNCYLVMKEHIDYKTVLREVKAQTDALTSFADLLNDFYANYGENEALAAKMYMEMAATETESPELLDVLGRAYNANKKFGIS